MKKLAIAALVLLGAVSTAQAAGDAAAGKTKAALCAACHGMDGNSPVNPVWPKLAGQHAGYIMKQLHDFKAGVRKNDTMSPMAAPLNDQDIENLAAWFSSQKRTTDSADKAKAEAGGKIFRGGIKAKNVAACMACHGPTGAGNPPAGFPSIDGQHAPYVAKQLKDFRDGARANDANGMMRGVVERMSDAEIDDVANMVSGLH